MEAKIDELLKLSAGKDADKLIDALDHKYMRTHGHAKPHGHEG